MPSPADIFGRLPVYSEEWGAEFLTTMHDYIESLEISVENEIENIVEGVAPTISGDSFCGCMVCYERETYLMATKLIIEGYEAGKVWLE